jgi:hypothetical protein
VHAGGEASNGPNERVLGRAQQPALRGAGCCFLLQHTCS